MFSPPSSTSRSSDGGGGGGVQTPWISHNRRLRQRPTPWIPHLARVPLDRKSEKGGDADPIQPVHIGEFPEEVRNAQASFLQKSVPSDARIFGGIDKGTSLSWVVYDNNLFIWRYLSSAASKQCTVLEIPPSVLDRGKIHTGSNNGNTWMVCMVNWNSTCTPKSKYEKQNNSAGLVLCNKNSQAIVYWLDIHYNGRVAPLVSLASSDGSEVGLLPADRKTSPNSQRQRSRLGSSYLVEKGCFNSFIVSAIPGIQHACVALAAGSDGELWKFECRPSGVVRERIFLDFNILSLICSDGGQALIGKGYPRSLIWRFEHLAIEESNRQFLLLTDHEIQCFVISLDSNLTISKLWSHEIVGTDNDLGIKKDLAGQKRIWPLDMQIDHRGKEFTVLVATFCKDRVSSSSYTQYSLLTMLYKPIHVSSDNISPICERVLEKKAPIQVIIPKARVEDENFLFSMKLRVGGKPSGSAIILSGDGTATVSNYWRSLTRLYQFDLPWDAGKVLDASIFPSTEDAEEGAWIVLTEKAGVWVIPEKAVLLGGVEPPERSLSRKGSSNEGAAEEEKRSLAFGGNFAPRRVSSEAWDAGDRQRAVLTRIAHRTAQDEESEALLGSLFHDFLLSGQVDDSLVKLRTSGAFVMDDETNVFPRMSKSIVDSLAKHWTTTRGAEIVAMAIVSAQLLDKQQKHHKFLQFLALSKCHEELSSRQRRSLQTIMEHGEKLAGIIQLREFQSSLGQNQSNGSGVSYLDTPDEWGSALWDLIQLIGEKTRRNTVLLMDRDNAEVFYSKVSDLEELFYCLSNQLQYIIGGEQPVIVQIKRACELSNTCTVIIRAAINYKKEHETWYPLSEGLTAWYCQPVVRNGLWCVASFMLQLLKESTIRKENLNWYSDLEQLTDVLLESYCSAVNAKVERREEHSGLLDEYWRRRDLLLSSLYKHVKGFVVDKYQHPADEESKEDLRKLSSPLLFIARRHEAYEILWKVCYDLSDSALLRNFMHKSVGPKGGFTYFVFKQLHENRQFAKLLRVGEEFQEELNIFLRQHKDLLWLHEVFLNHFSCASETLHSLGLSQEYATSATEEGIYPDLMRKGPSMADRKRQLNLSKIAAMAVAGKDDDYVIQTKRVDADLKILKLQEEIMALVFDNKEKQDVGLLPPEELVELCLDSNTPELSLRAFEVFAWTSSSFRQSNIGLLEECWKNAANQNDWGKLHHESIIQGWSDKQALQNLSETVLFQASERCYGPWVETFEAGFDEVLPLRRGDMDSPPSSVEGIIMQHKNFPEAGKLMLTAIMFSKVGVEIIAGEEGFMPLE